MDITDSTWADRMDNAPDKDTHCFGHIPDWARMEPSYEEIPPSLIRKYPPPRFPQTPPKTLPPEYSIPVKFSHKLSRRKYSREKTLRIEHHLKYLAHCEKKNKIPKGLRIATAVNPIQHNTPSDTRQRIDAIFRKAEKEVMEVLTSHYNTLLPRLNQELGKLESAISQSNPLPTPSQASTIHRATERAEREEDRLDGQLRRERDHKLQRLDRMKRPDGSRTPSRRYPPNLHILQKPHRLDWDVVIGRRPPPTGDPLIRLRRDPHQPSWRFIQSPNQTLLPSWRFIQSPNYTLLPLR